MKDVYCQTQTGSFNYATHFTEHTRTCEHSKWSHIMRRMLECSWQDALRMVSDWQKTAGVVDDWNNSFTSAPRQLIMIYGITYLSCKHLGGPVHSKCLHKENRTSKPYKADSHHRDRESQCTEQVERSAFLNPTYGTNTEISSVQHQVVPTNVTETLCSRSKFDYLMLQNMGKCDNCLKTICLLWSATFHVRQHANRQNLYLRFWKPLFFLRNTKHSTCKETYGVCHTTWNAHWSFVLHGRHHQYLLLQFAETACSPTHDKH